MYFDKVYRKKSKKGEILEYKLINENIEIDDTLLESLERSGMANIKRNNDDIELYYNI